MRIKELAKEIRDNLLPTARFTANGGVAENRERINMLLDLIGEAHEEHDLEYGHGLGQGTVLFFPDPQPTLREAARDILDSCNVFDKHLASVSHDKIDNLKSALEREND